MSRGTGRIAATWLALILAVSPAIARAGEPDRPLGDYAGSFELESGEVITGGPFIERAGGGERFLYMDAAGLEKLALLRREGELTLRSLEPPDAISIEFIPGPEGGLQELVWSGPEGALRGRRVYPHEERSPDITSFDGTVLHGRLLAPQCPGPHPLVVLVGGSGPTTRWAGVFDTWFVTLGMAVLAYDKRGVGEEDWYEPDLTTLAADAVSAVQHGAGVPQVDPGRVGIWASSQGGWVAPMAAVQWALDFLIVRVGPGVSELEAIVHEVRQEDRQKGLSGLELDHASALRREIYNLAVAGEPLRASDDLIAPYVEETWYQSSFGEGPISERWSERWWRWARDNMAVEPGPSLRRLDVPILWFLAENDENVPLVTSRAALQSAFADSRGEDETLVVIEDANHAFLLTGPDGAVRYAPGYFDRIRQWLAERGLSNTACWDGERA